MEIQILENHEPMRHTKRIVERFERSYVSGVLEKCEGVVVKAAEHAGIGRASFYRMLERLKPRGDK